MIITVAMIMIDIIMVGDLRDSVVLSCASCCQLQRAPVGK
jgi:hypothetical protein